MAFRTAGYKGVKSLTPKNHGMSRIAQQRLDEVVSRANQQYVNAIKVDGLSIHYWQRQERGFKCTCQGGEIHKGLSSESVEQTDDLSTLEEEAKAYRGDASDFKIVRKGDRTDYSSHAVGERDDYDGSFDSSEGSFDILDRLVGTVENDDEPLDSIQDDLSILQNGSNLYGGITTPCGICFGSGYTEGYSLLKGLRIVLDASHAHTVSPVGLVVDTEKYPHVFTAECDPQHYAEFEVELPSYFEKCYKVQLYNNLEEVGNARITANLDGATFTDISAAALNALKGKSNKLKIRVQAQYFDTSHDFRFTHLELVYQFSTWPVAQIPHINNDTLFNFASGYIAPTEKATASFVLSPEIPFVRQGDVLWEPKYNCLWRVTSISAGGYTTNRQTVGWEVEARLITHEDALYRLKTVYDPMIIGSFASDLRSQQLQGNEYQSAKSVKETVNLRTK